MNETANLSNQHLFRAISYDEAMKAVESLAAEFDRLVADSDEASESPVCVEEYAR